MSAQDPAWVHSWLETQREWLQRWSGASGEQRVDAIRETMESWRKQMTGPSAEVTGVLQKFQELLQTSFAGAGEWARMTAGEGNSATSPLLQLFQAFPLGPAREQQAAWQELTRAAAEYQSTAQEVSQAFARVVQAALERVPQQAELRAQQGKPLGGFRELFDLWVNAGEQEFARLAHDDDFVRLQARLNNTQMRLRRAQQRIVEYTLKQMDLPTRSELNSVHQRLRDLTTRLEELQQERTPVQAKPARAKRQTSKHQSS